MNESEVHISFEFGAMGFVCSLTIVMVIKCAVPFIQIYVGFLGATEKKCAYLVCPHTNFVGILCVTHFPDKKR